MASSDGRHKLVFISLRIKHEKQDYTQERIDWDRSVRSAIGRQNGPCEINAGYNVNLNPDWPNVPVGSWSI